MSVRRIIMVLGTVETLSYFSYQMKDTFERRGMEVFLWDMKDPMTSRERFSKLEDLDKSVLITFNFIGLSEEGQFSYDEDGRECSIWEHFGVKSICIMVDHPLYYYNQLTRLSENTMLYCVDREHVQFIKRYYPKYEHVFFMPLGGTELAGAAKKDIDIVFAGNYVRRDTLISRIETLDEDNKKFCYGIIQDLIDNPEVSLDEAIIGALKREIPDIGDDDILAVTHSLMVVDLYIRSYYREKIISYLAEQGYRILVIGKDWELSGCKRLDNLIRLGEQDSVTCLQYMQRAKISLNIMPWFKDGAHDRIYNAMLQGCAVVTDSSKYLDEELMDGVNVMKFTLGNYEEICNKIDMLISHEELRKSISKKGYLLAKNGHLWENNANRILKEIYNEGFGSS